MMPGLSPIGKPCAGRRGRAATIRVQRRPPSQELDASWAHGKEPEAAVSRNAAAQRARERERSVEADRGRQETPHRSLEGAGAGELVSPTRRRRAVEHLQRVFGVSQRWASQLVGQHRSPSVTSPSSLTGTGPCEPSCGSSAGVTRQPGRSSGCPSTAAYRRRQIRAAMGTSRHSKDERGLHTLEACGLEGRFLDNRYLIAGWSLTARLARERRYPQNMERGSSSISLRRSSSWGVGSRWS
jgi:hypothetical protein